MRRKNWLGLAFCLLISLTAAGQPPQNKRAKQVRNAHPQVTSDERNRPRSKGFGSIFKKAIHGIAKGSGRFAVNIVRGKPIVAGRELGKGIGTMGRQTGKGVARAGRKVGQGTKKLVRRKKG